jgi:hypothetical protein
MASEEIRSVDIRDLQVIVERDEEPLGNKLILTGAYFCFTIDNVKANEFIRLGKYLQNEGLKLADAGDLPED